MTEAERLAERLEEKAHNHTQDDTEQIYDNLVFHGGDGFTLFMRMFSESESDQETRSKRI